MPRSQIRIRRKFASAPILTGGRELRQARTPKAAGWLVLCAALLLGAITSGYGETAPDPAAASPDGSPKPGPDADTVLTFDDEFDHGALDASRWYPFYPWPCVINHELEAFVPDALVFAPGGGLRIVADKHAFAGQPYTSGALTTFGKFTQRYGYFVMRARLPKGRGFWAGFWLMPPPEAPEHAGGSEIDILEALGHDVHTIHTTLHSTDPLTGKNNGEGRAVQSGIDFSVGYHDYALSWRPQRLIWLIDGKEVFRIEGSRVPSIPEYLLVDLAVGGSWPGSPAAQTPFPSSLDVQCVKVYQYRDLPPAPPPAYFTVGAVTLSADAVPPGGNVAVTAQLTAGTTPYPALTLMAQLADYHGTYYKLPVTTTLQLAAGRTAPASLNLRVPPDLAPGRYTIGLGLTSAEPKGSAFIGCVGRFTVSAAP